jgi:glycosyltransferase involved in cell wall biosynthesis
VTRRRPALRRLGVYQDGPFRIVDSTAPPEVVPVRSDRAFLRFALAVGDEFASTVLFVRARHVEGDGAVAEGEALPQDVGYVELPFYDSLLAAGQVVRALPGTMRGFWRGLGRVDAVWALGPHPFSLVLVALALVRGKRVVLGVRQDTVAYYRSRAGERRSLAVLAARAWDACYRGLSRKVATVVVGAELERQYNGPRPGVLAIDISQLRSSDLVTEAPERDWSGPVRLLTVGRIDREKNPLLLVDAFARLCERRPHGFSLTWVGAGPLEDEVRRRAAERGVGDRIELTGFLPFGPELLDLYRAAHVFVHVSLTEGAPATITEALGSGTPVVATAVGGVPATLEHGQAGLLVPPADPDALVAAIERLVDDRALWERFVAYGPTVAAPRTLDLNAKAVARFIAAPGPV